MTTFLASFVIFLGAATALALGTRRGRDAPHGCGSCAREDARCPGPAHTSQEVD